MQDENVQLTKMISNLENSSILVLVNKKSYFFINLLLKTDYKVNVMNYENIFLAMKKKMQIHLLLNGNYHQILLKIALRFYQLLKSHMLFLL